MSYKHIPSCLVGTMYMCIYTHIGYPSLVNRTIKHSYYHELVIYVERTGAEDVKNHHTVKNIWVRVDLYIIHLDSNIKKNICIKKRTSLKMYKQQNGTIFRGNNMLTSTMIDLDTRQVKKIRNKLVNILPSCNFLSIRN